MTHLTLKMAFPPPPFWYFLLPFHLLLPQSPFFLPQLSLLFLPLFSPLSYLLCSLLFFYCFPLPFVHLKIGEKNAYINGLPHIHQSLIKLFTQILT